MSEYKIMTQKRGASNLVQHIPCRLHKVNIPLEMQVQGSIPVNLYDIYTDWILTVQRADYFVDEVSGLQYSVFGDPPEFVNHTEIRVSRPVGTVP